MHEHHHATGLRMSPATRLGCLLFIPLSLYEKTPAILAALATLCGAVFAADNAPAPAARDGLLLEYKFEGDAADSSGHARAGKVHGHPTFATGRAGQCLVLDGGGAFIETSLTSADLGQTFTVDCWVKPDSRQNTHADIN